MSRYEKLLHMLMDYDVTILFTAIGDTSGNILWNTTRNDSKVKVPLSEIKKTLLRESADWIERCKIEDSDDLGRALYHIASFQKIKQITVPLDAFHLLMIYVDNTPLDKTKTKSYGRYVEMGKIMSIIDFVNTFEE
ncbi:MAG: hypothetical protein ABR53_03015 [Nitrosopumilus sp. BACL13 MAG-121220-bin23]|jgi:hypothetical protein|nr:MAG: hypothetical protein ABR53_03015 [Nitrosopumilus sp. BACL13 MAG-121220-bin23]